MKKVQAHCGVNIQIGNYPDRIWLFVSTAQKIVSLENESFENSHTYKNINWADENLMKTLTDEEMKCGTTMKKGQDI